MNENQGESPAVKSNIFRCKTWKEVCDSSGVEIYIYTIHCNGRRDMGYWARVGSFGREPDCFLHVCCEIVLGLRFLCAFMSFGEIMV